MQLEMRTDLGLLGEKNPNRGDVLGKEGVGRDRSFPSREKKRGSPEKAAIIKRSYLVRSGMCLQAFLRWGEKNT